MLRNRKREFLDNASTVIENPKKAEKQLRQAIRQSVSDYNTLRPHEALDYAAPEDVYLSCFAPLSASLDRTPLAC